MVLPNVCSDKVLVVIPIASLVAWRFERSMLRSSLSQHDGLCHPSLFNLLSKLPCPSVPQVPGAVLSGIRSSPLGVAGPWGQRPPTSPYEGKSQLNAHQLTRIWPEDGSSPSLTTSQRYF